MCAVFSQECGCMGVYMCVMYVHICVHMCVHVCGVYVHMSVNVCVHVCTQVCICTHVYLYACICVQVCGVCPHECVGAHICVSLCKVYTEGQSDVLLHQSPPYSLHIESFTKPEPGCQAISPASSLSPGFLAPQY